MAKKRKKLNEEIERDFYDATLDYLRLEYRYSRLDGVSFDELMSKRLLIYLMDKYQKREPICVSGQFLCTFCKRYVQENQDRYCPSCGSRLDWGK